MKVSRREIAMVAAGSALAAKTLAQTPPASPGSELARTVREANQRNSEALAKFDLPTATEPAFQFRA